MHYFLELSTSINDRCWPLFDEILFGYCDSFICRMGPKKSACSSAISRATSVVDANWILRFFGYWTLKLVCSLFILSSYFYSFFVKVLRICDSFFVYNGKIELYSIHCWLFSSFKVIFNSLQIIYKNIIRLERWRTSLGISAFLIAFGLFLFTWQSTQLDLRGFFFVIFN